MTDLTTTSDQKKTDTSKGKANGKIFISPDPYEEPSKDSFLSLGHRIFERLNENADLIIYVDYASGRSWTGKELKRVILNVSMALIDQYDFKQGSVACISYDHSDYSCILALAVICVGGIVACSYPKDPYPELLYLAEKVQPKFLFCHHKNLHWAQQLERDLGHHVQAISMDDEHNNSTSEQQHQNLYSTFIQLLNYDHTKSKSLHKVPVVCKDIERDVALITMSSGTTGRPKAVPTTHKKCITDLFSTTKHRRSKGLKVASPASLDYVSSRLIVFGAFDSGFTAIIMNGFDPKTFAEAIEKYKIHVVYLGADSFYVFITYKDLNKYDLSSLKLVFPMGAKIVYMDAMKEFLEKHPNITQVRQGFGASEICGGAINTMTPEEYIKDCDNCGRLLPGVRAKIVDPETGELLGPNQEGELHIQSASEFLGYYDASRLNTKSITDKNANNESSPFVSDSTIFDEDGFYITGDLAKFNDKEELYIVGRRKELMSCRNAAKVLPQELERIIEQHPAVSKVSVLGIQNKARLTIQCPRAFIVVKPNYYTESVEELIFSQRLPPEQRGDLADDEVEDNLTFTGQHKLCKMSADRRHKLSINIMEFVNDRVGWEKRLTGGIVLIDEVPTLRSTGKVNKSYLRSLDVDQIEIYGDRSME